jgi:hypothetical protein
MARMRYAEAPDKEKYCAVPEWLRAAYDQQSELLFREILSCIGQAEMARIIVTFKCRLNTGKQEKARTTVGDGVTPMRNLLSKHGKNDAYTISDLEDRFAAAPQDFTFGSPALKVHNLRAQLSEVLCTARREAQGQGITDCDSYYRCTIRQTC